VIKGKKMMQKQQYVRQNSGAKAIAIDNRALLLRYRLLQLLAVILTAATALGLHLIFAH
jgi:hypothetical protein